MKRILSIGIAASIVALCGSAIYLHTARAQSAPMTEAHIQKIRANCVDAQQALIKLHANDALLRVNRGQLYESISTKLMTPFNSRTIANKYDGSRLVERAATYEKQLNEFRADYIIYEEAMSRTLRINCTNEPVAFYDSVNETRLKRQSVHQRTTALQKTIQDYKNDFEEFARQIEGKE